MDQKNQGQRPGTPQSGQQHTQPDQPTTQNPNREPGEGPRHQQMPSQDKPGSQHEQTRGNQGEGISNRGLDRELEEQSELPERGSSQSER